MPGQSERAKVADVLRGMCVRGGVVFRGRVLYVVSGMCGA